MLEETIPTPNRAIEVEVIIPRGKGAIISIVVEAMLAFLSVFAVSLLVALFFTISYFDGSSPLPFIATVALPLLVSLLVGLGVFSFRRSQSNKIAWALRANAEGIFDNTGIPVGLIRWEEIAAIESGSQFGVPRLVIRLRDSRAFLNRLPLWQQFLFAPNTPFFGSPAVISPFDLAISVDEARHILEAAQHPPVSLASPAPVPIAPTGRWWTAIPPEERKVLPLTRRSASDSDR